MLPSSHWCSSHRPTYRQTEGPRHYLYHINDGVSGQWWVVGPASCQGWAVMAAKGGDQQLLPQDVNYGTWLEVYNESWNQNSTVKVECKGRFCISKLWPLTMFTKRVSMLILD